MRRTETHDPVDDCFRFPDIPDARASFAFLLALLPAPGAITGRISLPRAPETEIFWISLSPDRVRTAQAGPVLKAALHCLAIDGMLFEAVAVLGN